MTSWLDLVGVQIRSYWHTECACGKILAFGTDNFGTYWGTEGKADGQTEGWWCVVKMDRGQLKERESGLAQQIQVTRCSNLLTEFVDRQNRTDNVAYNFFVGDNVTDNVAEYTHKSVLLVGLDEPASAAAAVDLTVRRRVDTTCRRNSAAWETSVLRPLGVAPRPRDLPDTPGRRQSLHCLPDDSRICQHFIPVIVIISTYIICMVSALNVSSRDGLETCLEGVARLS